ncbi:hypothetical protein [Elizabethkingia miricola]|uniref:hypothetical protein n=1 Tax=Elizabethkingia miricola TaxID=172045 RepID=UPI000B34F1E4|nr:hypothetical protein [Elizabethkingia miricola]
MRLSEEMIKDLEAVSLPIIKSEDSGIGIDNLFKDAFPGQNIDFTKDRVKQCIYILKEHDLIIEEASKLFGFEYYASERLKYNSIHSIALDINKVEDKKDLELEKTINENEFIKRQLKDYKITKIIAYVGLAIAIASFFVSIFK